MAQFVAFLRAINVGGRFIKMAALAEHFHTLGFEDAVTFISSGNVIFSARSRSTQKLELSIQEKLEPLLGFKSDVFLRSAIEVQQIAERGLSLLSRHATGGDVNIAFFTSPLSEDQQNALVALQRVSENAADTFEFGDREVYWVSKNKQSETKISNALFERKLGARTTFRRANMLARLSTKLFERGR